MSIELAKELRAKHLPPSVLKGDRSSTIKERTALLEECVRHALPVISMGGVVGKVPASPQDKNWRGRALEVFLGGANNSAAKRDFDDGELKSTRVVRKNEKWAIEQTLRITTLSHADFSHLDQIEKTPFYDKISCFNCVLFDSKKGDIEGGTIVGHFVFRIEDDPIFLAEITEDYRFYVEASRYAKRISSKIKSPNGFLGCRQTAGIAGAISKTSLYITPVKFNLLLEFYGING
jgi:hypothetical protein